MKPKEMLEDELKHKKEIIIRQDILIKTYDESIHNARAEIDRLHEIINTLHNSFLSTKIQDSIKMKEMNNQLNSCNSKKRGTVKVFISQEEKIKQLENENELLLMRANATEVKATKAIRELESIKRINSQPTHY